MAPGVATTSRGAAVVTPMMSPTKGAGVREASEASMPTSGHAWRPFPEAADEKILSMDTLSTKVTSLA